MTYPDYFLRKDFAYYDSCAAQVVGNLEDRIYDHIRRYTWRGRSMSEQASQLVKEGCIYSKISQSKIAEMVGCGRQAANKAIAKLKALGWLDVVNQKNQGTAFYVTGEKVRDSNGSVHEVFYYDAWMRDLWEHLENEAAREFGSEDSGRTTAEDDLVQPEHRSPVRTTPISWRIQKTAEFVDKRLGVVASDDRGCRLENAKQPSSVSEATGVVVSGRQGLSSQGDTGSREENQIENREGREALPAPAAREGDPQPSDRGLSPELGCEDSPGAGHSAGGRARESEGARASAASESEGGNEGTTDGSDSPGEESDHVVANDGRMGQAREAIGSGVERARSQIRKNRQRKLDKSRSDDQRQQNLKGRTVGQTLKDLEAAWTGNMHDVFPNLTIAKWGGKERGQVRQLLDKYNFSIVKEAMQYLICRWEDLNDRILRGRGSYPSVGLLLSLHDTIVLEAQGTEAVTRVEREIEEWRQKNPTVARAPAHLKEKLERAKEAAGQ